MKKTQSSSGEEGAAKSVVNSFPNKWWALAVLAASVSLIVIDGTIVNVALPSMVQDLSLTFANAQWITTIYTLVFSVLLLMSGRLADALGRKKTLIFGIVVFTGASLYAALSTSAQMLILARAIQGLGAAAVLPTTLSTVNATFQGRDRSIAFGVWGSVISGMAALGPLLGGWLTTYYTWHWIFYLNLPVGALILLGIFKYVPETKGNISGRGIDVDGFLLSALALGGIVFALIEGRNRGWWKPIDGSDLPLSAAAFAWMIGLVGLALFVVWEIHRINNGRNKLLDLRLFKISSFSLGNIAAATIAIGEFGLLFVLPLYLQNSLALTPLQSGYVLAAMAAGAFVSGGIAGPLARKTSAQLVARSGLAIEGVALFGLFALGLGGDNPVFKVTFFLVVYGIGLGMASAQLTSTVLADVPADYSGQASATQSTARQIGTALGVAIVATFMASSLVTQASGSLSDIEGLPAAQSTQIEQSLSDSAGAVLRAFDQPDNPRMAHIPAQTRKEIVQNLSAAFDRSASNAMGIAGIFIGFGFLATLGLKPQRKKVKVG